MTHGHEVLDMMQGNAYASAEDLTRAIVAKFGADERFYICSATDLTAAELVAFLQAKGKFMPAEGGFTSDPSKRCSHDGKKMIPLAAVAAMMMCAFGSAMAEPAAAKDSPAFLELAKARFSVRYYDPKPVEQAKIDVILEAARVAPTANTPLQWAVWVCRLKTFKGLSVPGLALLDIGVLLSDFISPCGTGFHFLHEVV